VNKQNIAICEKKGAKLASLLKEEREKKNISKNKLSEDSGLSSSSILKIENGSRKPTLLSLTFIAKALDIELWTLLKKANI
jgi:transcriptional regulator with XRE-family HTH domain